jgi:hypothetical protein
MNGHAHYNKEREEGCLDNDEESEEDMDEEVLHDEESEDDEDEVKEMVLVPDEQETTTAQQEKVREMSYFGVCRLIFRHCSYHAGALYFTPPATTHSPMV